MDSMSASIYMVNVEYDIITRYRDEFGYVGKDEKSHKESRIEYHIAPTYRKDLVEAQIKHNAIHVESFSIISIEELRPTSILI